MKPFDLEKAKAGHPVQTRDGRNVRILCFDRKGTCFQIIALIQDGNEESAASYKNDGQLGSLTSPSDLFMAPRIVTRFVNFYKSGIAEHFDTEDVARRTAARSNDPLRLTAVAVPVQIEE